MYFVTGVTGLIVLYLLDDRHLVVVTNAVFTQEVELHHTFVSVQRLVQGDVLDAQRTAAHRVRRLSLFLLVTSPQRQLMWVKRSRDENTDMKPLSPTNLNLFVY